MIPIKPHVSSPVLLCFLLSCFDIGYAFSCRCDFIGRLSCVIVSYSLAVNKIDSVTLSASSGEEKSEFENVYTPKVIGVYMHPSVEYIVSVLSILRIGEAFLPLDPSWPKERILSIIAVSNVDLIIYSGISIGVFLDKSHWLMECGASHVLHFSIEESIQKLINVSNYSWPCENEMQRSFCYLMYTSGSTGKPKGVCGTEQGKQVHAPISKASSIFSCPDSVMLLLADHMFFSVSVQRSFKPLSMDARLLSPAWRRNFIVQDIH